MATQGRSEPRPSDLPRARAELARRGEGAKPASGRVRGVVEPKPARVISDAQNTENVRGPIVRREDDLPTGDVATDQAYDGLGDTFSLPGGLRPSLDRRRRHAAARSRSLRRPVPERLWDGQRMVFGDGDGQVLGVMTGACST